MVKTNEDKLIHTFNGNIVGNKSRF